MNLYKEIIVWKRTESHIIRYLCLQNLESEKFCVQNADFVYRPADAEYLSQLDNQKVELLLEEDPAIRCDWFPSLHEAIKNHDESFGN